MLRKWFGKLLCRLGRHNWVIGTDVGDKETTLSMYCPRCRLLKIERWDNGLKRELE